MKLIDITNRIANEFSQARKGLIKAHPLAKAIRDDWPEAAWEVIEPAWSTKLQIKGSPGLGNWNEAPWLAFFHRDVTDTARAGYYPIFLYEPGFKTYCLVLAQGTDLLRETFGRREARRVIAQRALELRSVAAKGWQRAGFQAGPFETFSRLGGSAPDADSDGWSASVAFGKRYSVESPPADAEIRRDLANMLKVYSGIVDAIGNKFTSQDNETGMLADSGELPPTGLDGALKVVEHKKLETRVRNSKLAREVKAKLGYRCQGCFVDLTRAYPALGKEFIEAHHKKPLSEAPPAGVELTVEDFAVLCPTCHRVIHRLGCPSLEDFIARVPQALRDFHGNMQ